MILNQLKFFDKYAKNSTVAHKILKRLSKRFDIIKIIIKNKEMILNIDILIRLLLSKNIMFKYNNPSQVAKEVLIINFRDIFQ